MTRFKVGIKNTSYLVAGNIISQILGYLFILYIARKLGPSEFGVFNIVGAFVGMFGFLTFSGYQKVLIRQTAGQTHKLKENIENVITLKITLSLIGVGIAIISAFLVNYEPRIAVFISIYAFTLLFNDVSSVIHVVFHSQNDMKYITYASLIQKIIYIVPTSLCIYLGGGVEFLIIFFTLSTLVNVFINYLFATKKFAFELDLKKIKNINLDKNLFKQASVFSFLSFIGYFWSKIDIVMLSWLMDQKSVGLYCAGYKLIQPMEMLGNMAAVAFFPLTVERFKQNNPVRVKSLLKTCLQIAAVVIPMSILITIFSKEIISVLYGSEYRGSDLVLKYLCWVIPLGLINWPLILSMQATHNEDKFILPNIMRSISNIVLNYIFIIRYGMIGVVYSTIITYAGFFSIISAYMFYILKRDTKII